MQAGPSGRAPGQRPSRTGAFSRPPLERGPVPDCAGGVQHLRQAPPRELRLNCRPPTWRGLTERRSRSCSEGRGAPHALLAERIGRPGVGRSTPEGEKRNHGGARFASALPRRGSRHLLGSGMPIAAVRRRRSARRHGREGEHAVGRPLEGERDDDRRPRVRFHPVSPRTVPPATRLQKLHMTLTRPCDPLNRPAGEPRTSRSGALPSRSGEPCPSRSAVPSAT